MLGVTLQGQSMAPVPGTLVGWGIAGPPQSLRRIAVQAVARITSTVGREDEVLKHLKLLCKH